MAYIENEYILLDRKKSEKTVEQITFEYLSKTEFELKDGYFENEEGLKVNYYIETDIYSDRYYLKLSTKTRFNKAVEILQKFDDTLTRTNYNQYIGITKVYDGISFSLCEKLYPKYALFERKLRQLILIVLTKAYKEEWPKETISDETMGNIKAKNKGTPKLSEILEQFDLAQLEAYLFEDRTIDYTDFIKNELSYESIDSMTKEELQKKIELMRPKSLWEKNFSDIGSTEKWKSMIKEVHDCRNTVAHHKTIKIDEYKDIGKKLNLLNKELTNAITIIQERDFSDIYSVEVLYDFSEMLVNISKSLISMYDYSGVIDELIKRIINIMEPLKKEIMIQVADVVKYYSKGISNLVAVSPRYIEMLDNIAKLERKIVDNALNKKQINIDKEED